MYEIRVRNQTEHCWREWFEDMAITELENGDVLIRGLIVDQSALHGLLDMIRDLNLTLIYVKKISEEASNDEKFNP